MVDLIPYYRVSTKQQGASGLGLEGQRAAVEAYARQTGGAIKASYTEVESGKKSDRPELARALSHARRSKAVLVVAKLDRLSRNVAFLSALLESKVMFIACDNPQATDLTLHILAAVAEAEAKAISSRTRTALAAYKARGGKLGSARDGHWVGREDMRLKGLEKARSESGKANARLADDAYVDLVPTVREMKDAGLSLRDMAAKLNADGHTTRRGKPWNPVQVARVLERIK